MSYNHNNKRQDTIGGKIFKQLLFSILIIVPSLALVAVAASSDYKVGTWANFSKSAVTHTFDDGTKNQFSVAMPLFDKFGFKMTFATVTSGWMFPGWEVLKQAFNNRHEIASHSVTHIGAISEDEMKRSQEAIKKNVPGEQCISMIFPYCRVPGDEITKKYYEAGRVCGSGPEGPTPGNFIRVASLTVGEGGGDTELNGYSNSAIKKNGWAVYLHHGVDGDHNWAHTKSSTLENHLKYLSENQDKFWVETFGNVVRYIKERNSVSVTEISATSNSFTINVSDTLNNEIYNYPLTMRRPLPETWTPGEISVIQADKILKHSIITGNGKKYIQFKAVPDGGEVVISNDATAIRHGITSASGLDANLIRLHKNVLIIYSGNLPDREMAVRLFNLNGKLLARHLYY